MAASNKINNTSGIILEEFAKDIENTALKVQRLLDEIREGEADFAAVKTELRILSDNFKELSHIIRDGNGHSLLTRLALVEEVVNRIEAWIEKTEANHKEAEVAEATVKVANANGKWQLIVALSTGVLSLIASILALLMNLPK